MQGHKRPPNVLEMMKQFNSIDANTDSIGKCIILYLHQKLIHL